MFSLKYFLAKKKYYIEKLKTDPGIVERSKFLQIIIEQKESRQDIVGRDLMDTDPIYLFVRRATRQANQRQTSRVESVYIKGGGAKLDILNTSDQQLEKQPADSAMTLKKHIDEMKSEYMKMLDQIEIFKNENNDLDEFADNSQNEILFCNRIIKREVLDIADLVEKVSQSMVT